MRADDMIDYCSLGSIDVDDHGGFLSSPIVLDTRNERY
jgi:hypothetical protein